MGRCGSKPNIGLIETITRPKRSKCLADKRGREAKMKSVLLTAIIGACSLFAAQTHAASAECEAKATDKKLAGAAKASYLKKCAKDAAPSTCEMAAAQKGLAGAAKNSSIKKCISDGMTSK